MTFEIYHQLGHNFKWNLDSLELDQCGDGVILAPRYMKKDTISSLSENLKRSSIFDPQFYLPDSPKGKLETYDFFPDNAAGGFCTEDYSECAIGGAKSCISFQEENNFKYIVIPTRYYRGTPSDFIQNQENLFVRPFLDQIGNKYKNPLLLQVILNDLMLKDDDYISDILNWITSLEIEGVYLIIEANSSSKQIKDADYLLSLFKFIDALKTNNLKVVIGYLNTEAVLLSLADPDIVTMGTYENTRAFKIRTFEITEDSVQAGPNPRLYISKLLQWIEYPYISFIRRAYKNLEDIFDINKYQAEMFEKSFNWHFSKPQLYKHHFLVFSDQLRRLSKLKGKKRYEMLKNMLSSSIEKFEELSSKGIVLDTNSDGSHLYIWATVANIYASEKGWR